MKMKRIYLIALITILFGACSDSFLDTEPTKPTSDGFYLTEDGMVQALTASYAVLTDVPDGWVVVGYPFAAADLMSDDRFGAMGQNDRGARAVGDFMVVDDNQFHDVWVKYYRGIYRVNLLIENLDAPTYTNETRAGQIAGEARFLRAMLYFDMVRMFGNIPLILESAPANNPQAPAEEVYAQIALDLKAAIESFPDAKGQLGRGDKYSAQALMARVFLFYTGYYEQNSLPLPDGGSIDKAQVISWLEDCVDGPYDLMPDFRNLWPYSHLTSANSDEPYKYAEDNELEWYGETGDNIETMFMFKFSTFADWGTSIYYSNQMNLFNGWRSYSYQGSFGEGWGMGTVNSKLWEEWPDDDLRKRASIINVKDEAEIARHGVDNYGYGEDFHDSQMEETGMWQKKYRAYNVNKDGEWANYSVFLYGAEKNMQLDNMQDIVIIRFADVLLMHSELSETVDGINAVRERAGLEPIGGYSLEALKKERRYELAFEGLRYHDILRWAGKSNLQEAKAIIDAQNGVSVINNGVQETKTMNFRVETGGFVQIPSREILLSDGVLKQNPGWESGPYY